MEKMYYHKPFSKNCNKPVDHFLFLFGGLILQVEFQSPFSNRSREFDMETDVFT